MTHYNSKAERGRCTVSNTMWYVLYIEWYNQFIINDLDSCYLNYLYTTPFSEFYFAYHNFL